MNVPVISTHIILLTFILKEISSFITRLPACKYSANYTMKHKGNYFNGNVSLAIQNVSAHKCTLYCTLNDSCLFFNHKVDGTMCELLMSHIGVFEVNKEWDVVSTNYSDWKFRGPMCRFLRPTCDYDIEYCIDTCESPGYKCNKLVNIAKGKVTRASSIWDGNHISGNIVDDNTGTIWGTVLENKSWIMVDLSTSYKILFFTIISTDVYRDLMTSVTIRIGNNDDKISNEICLDKQNQNGIAKKNYFCKEGPMIGRYVFLLSNLHGYMSLAELRIYSL